MKNIFKSLCIGAAAFAMVACQNEPLAVVNLSESTAPVLNELTGSYVLEEGGDFATFTWSEADFGLNVGIRYTLYTQYGDNSARSIDYVANDTSLSVDADTINDVLVSKFELEGNTEYEVEFYLQAAITSTSGISAGTINSNTISVKITPYAQEPTHPKLWAVGDFNSWTHSKATFLYNYEDDEVLYQGLIDFGESYTSHAYGFKLTDAADWDHGDYGSDGNDTEGANEDMVNLASAGANILTWQGVYRYFHFTCEPASMWIKRTVGFNAATVTVGGAEYELTYYLGHQKMYADVESAEGTAVVKLDGTELFSEELSVSGQARVYVDLNNWDEKTITASASKYGTDESADAAAEEEEEADPTFSINGAMTGWSATAMTEDSANGYSYYVITLECSALDQYGFLDLTSTWWSANGATYKENDDDEYYVVTVGDHISCNLWSETGGTVNMAVPEAGTYDFYVIPSEGIHILMAEGEVPAILVAEPEFQIKGAWNNWSALDMRSIGTDTYRVYYYGSLTASAGNGYGYNDLHEDGEWWAANNTLYSDATVTLGKAYYCRHWYDTDDGTVDKNNGYTTNLVIAEDGTYDFYAFYDSGYQITVEAGVSPWTNAWGIVGSFNSWGGSYDILLVEESEGVWVCNNFYSPADNQIKVRHNSEWKSDYGADSWESGVATTAVSGGSNISIATEGYYSLVLNINDSTITITAL